MSPTWSQRQPGKDSVWSRTLTALQDTKTDREIGRQAGRVTERHTGGQVTRKTSTGGPAVPSTCHPAHGRERRGVSGQCQSTDPCYSRGIVKTPVIHPAVHSGTTERQVLQLFHHHPCIHLSVYASGRTKNSSFTTYSNQDSKVSITIQLCNYLEEDGKICCSSVSPSILFTNQERLIDV